MITLQFTLPVPDPRINTFNIYRKRGSAAFSRIAQIPTQLQYTDVDGITGDSYYFTYFDSVRFLESGPSPVITATDALDSITITGFAIGNDGRPTGQDVEVSITLQSLSSSVPTSDGQLIMSMRQVVVTDDAGMFVFDAIPNDKIFPGRTFYKIEYLGNRFFKEIKSTSGKAQLFTNLVDVLPKELR